ncbi:MAG TPA: diguanylate cyclase [Actinomycetales bacterium]|nr:diguanylate cyclase [Actinomycetales bacterium]
MIPQKAASVPAPPADDAMARAVGMMQAAHRITTDLMQLRDLDAALDAVVHGALSLGFGVAVMNVVQDDGTVAVTTVAGPDSVRETLLGVREPLALWQRLLDACEDWGALRFMPHDVRIVDEMNEWVVTEGEPIHGLGPWFPDPSRSRIEPWHPEDSLFAPMYDADGALLAVLCVDVPLDGRRPGPLQRQLLELFTSHARVALENVRLHQAAEQSRAQLEREKETFREAFDASPTGMAMTSRRPGLEGRVIRANASLARMLGRTQEELCGGTLTEHVHRADLRGGQPAWADRAVTTTELRYLDAQGTTFWVSQSSITVRDANGTPQYDLVNMMDITASKSREHTLEHDAQHDTLSGVANRRGLHAHLAEPSADESMAIVFCDLNEFKSVNDRWGHARGDAVLVEVARRIDGCVRGRDLVARFGGDEFVVVCRDITLTQAHDLARRIEHAVAAPMTGDLAGLRITTSTGIAFGWPRSVDDAQDLLLQADQRMLSTKTSR